jgi:hypothetical protein
MYLRIEMIDRIRAALDSSERCSLIRECLDDGCRLTELYTAFVGGDYRFVLLKSATDIEIVHIDELRGLFENALLELRQAANALVVQDMTAPSREAMISQAYIRTRVAEVARRTELVQLRTERFLGKGESLEEDAIETVLADVGFEWNGGGMVQEIWSEEHQRRDDEVYAIIELRKHGNEGVKA